MVYNELMPQIYLNQPFININEMFRQNIENHLC